MTEIEELREEIEELREENADLRERVGTLEETVETQEETISELREENEELREENEELREDRDKAREQRKRLLADTYEVDERLTELEQQFTLDPDRTPDDGSTSIERIVSWPDAAAEEELSSNAQRARNVAMNLGEFTDRTPRGLKLGSSEVRKALTARTGETPHTSTVYRVMDFLEQFGETLIREDTVRKGERRLYWVEDAPDRLTDASHGDVIETRENNPEET